MSICSGILLLEPFCYELDYGHMYSLLQVILTSVVLFCVDYAGRRKFLLWGTLLMAVGIACLGFVTLSQPPGISNVSCENNLPHDLITVVSTYNQTQGGVGRSPRLPRDHSLAFPFRIPATNHSHSAIPKEMKTHLKWLSFLSLVVYIAGYALGFGPGELCVDHSSLVLLHPIQTS